MNDLVTNIMKAVQGNQHLITKPDADEIILALTCNLEDLRTRSYAKFYFPNFFKKQLDAFKGLVAQLEFHKADESKYLNPAKNSVIILESALNVFNDRMENMNFNE